MTSDSLAPYSDEAELAVLGSILMNPACLATLLPWLKANDFFVLRNHYVFDAILILHERGEAIDNLTVIDVLRDQCHLDEIGGSAFITYLVNNTPTHVHAYTYARIIESAARRRRLLAVASGIAQGAISSTPKDEIKHLIQVAQSLLEPMGENTDDFRQYLIHASELDNLPVVSWLIPGELPERGLCMYFGPSGVGKSFIALNHALMLSEKIPVVYIAAEGEYGFAARVAAWCRHYKRDPKGLNIWFFMNVVSIIDDAERHEFISLIERIKPKLIVVDTVAHCMLPGNENDTREMGMFIKGTKALQKKFECAALLVHHTSKSGRIERGSGSLRNACDVIARITDDDDVICFECSKSKDATPFPTRYLKLLPVELTKYPSTPVVIAAERIVQTDRDPLTRNQQKILDALSLEAYENGLTRAELVDMCEIGNGSIGRALSALKKFGYISQSGRGDRYLKADDSHDSVDSPKPRSTESSRKPHSVNQNGADDSVDSVDSLDSPGSSPQKTRNEVSQPSHHAGNGHGRPIKDDSLYQRQIESLMSQPSHLTADEINIYAFQAGVKFGMNASGAALAKIYDQVPESKRPDFNAALSVGQMTRLLEHWEAQEAVGS